VWMAAHRALDSGQLPVWRRYDQMKLPETQREDYWQVKRPSSRADLSVRVAKFPY
jgi:hypothetical protein